MQVLDTIETRCFSADFFIAIIKGLIHEEWSQNGRIKINPNVSRQKHLPSYIINPKISSPSVILLLSFNNIPPIPIKLIRYLEINLLQIGVNASF